MTDKSSIKIIAERLCPCQYLHLLFKREEDEIGKEGGKFINVSQNSGYLGRCQDTKVKSNRCFYVILVILITLVIAVSLLVLGIMIKSSPTGTKMRILSQEESDYAVKVELEGLKNWGQSEYLQKANLSSKTNYLETVSSRLHRLCNFFNCSGKIDPKSTSPSGFVDALKLGLADLGYKISPKFEFLMKIQPLPSNLNPTNWIVPLHSLWEYFDDRRVWYGVVCIALEEQAQLYNSSFAPFSTSKDTATATKSTTNKALLDYLSQLPFMEKHKKIINTVGRRLDLESLEVAENIILSRLAIPILKCETISGSRSTNSYRKLTVSGKFVKLSQFISKDGTIKSVCGGGAEIRYLEIYAFHTVFIDENINGKGKKLNIIILSPKWFIVVSGNISSRYFNLNGDSAENRNNRAKDGENSNSGNGGSGENGLAGMPGKAGGSFLGFGLELVGQLTVDAKGGAGGKGQDGGNGGRGAKGRDAPINGGEPHPGYPGFQGGSGGDGGVAGEGGDPGWTLGKFPKTNFIKISVQRGQQGIPGSGGSKGKCGEYGQQRKCKREFFFHKPNEPPIPYVLCSLESPYKMTDCNSQNGKNGVSRPNFQAPEKATPIPVYTSALNFKYSTSATNQNQLFIEYIENDVELKAVAYIYELEKILQEPTANTNHLFSLERKSMSYYSTANITADEKSAMRKVLAVIYSKEVALNTDKQSGMVVDLSSFFNYLKGQMESYKEADYLVKINQARKKFNDELTERISRIKKFTDGTALPALTTANIKLQAKLLDLKELPNEIRLSAEAELDQTKSEREKAIASMRLLQTTKGIFAYLSIAVLISSTLVPPLAGVGSAIDIFGQVIVDSIEVEDISKLNEKIKKLEDVIKDIPRLTNILEGSINYVVSSLLEGIQNISSTASNVQNNPEDTDQFKQWLQQLLMSCKAIKVETGRLGGYIQTNEFDIAVNAIQDSLTMLVAVINDIFELQNTASLANYMANILEAGKGQDSSLYLSKELDRLDKILYSDLFLKDYTRALGAFKQWVFPFAKLHLTKDLQLEGLAMSYKISDVETKSICMKKLDMLHLQFQKYKGSTLSAQDSHVIHTKFSSEHKSTRPFYAWKGKEWSGEIRRLLNGEQVSLKADIRNSEVGKDAVKFNLIEIKFKIQNNQKQQLKLDSELKEFGVMMTHNGMSYYRFLGKFYYMTGVNQTIRYNFEEDGNGNRLGTNQIYEKFKSGDFLLSPYTWWTFQLVKSAESGFDKLKKFSSASYIVDLELVGTGIYVDSGRVESDMDVDKYYGRDWDNSIRNYNII